MVFDDDRPMALGDHLDELRSRLIKVIVVLALAVIVGMIFQVEIKLLFEQPLRRAIELADPEAVTSVGLPTDPDASVFQLLHLAESAMNAVRVSFYLALAVAFPVLIYQLWAFITPGLRRSEKAAGFLFVPAAVIFFYAGILFGYFLGLPFLYKLLIEWTAKENAVLVLRQSYYLGFFFTMTLVFGMVMDIPWLVMVLVRMRVVTPAQVAAKRRHVLLVGTVLAAIATPPDPVSLVTMLVLMVVLFELGLMASRFLYRAPELVSDELVDSVPPPPGDDPANNDGRAPWDEGGGPGLDPQDAGDASDDDADDDPVARPSAWDRAMEPDDGDTGRGDDSDRSGPNDIDDDRRGGRD